jgi:hypothetical protein
MDNNDKKSKQLGMPIGTATHRLRKLIMFDLLKKFRLNFCFQCSEEIISVDDLSIEHKTPWLDSDNPLELFYSLDNIAFSHSHCNIKAARRKTGLNQTHGTLYSYMTFGCRCDTCKEAKSLENKRNRK